MRKLQTAWLLSHYPLPVARLFARSLAVWPSPVQLFKRMHMVSIRPYQPADWPTVWPFLRATFEAGDTYAFSPSSTEADIHRAWVQAPAATFVACNNAGQPIATYYIKPNQPGLGAHVCNCGYVVAALAQGQGMASALCEHSQAQAVAMGFLAMQFNLVVSTNIRAVRLWQRLGFAIVGTLPLAFEHQQLGLVDALVMYKTLQRRSAAAATPLLPPAPLAAT